ncbi:MAG TPA: DUF3105 domain-containing protein [Chloroflexota bacterium]|jgi:hypothetical protein
MPVSTREDRRLQRKTERHAAQRKVARGANVRRNAVLGAVGAVVIAAAIVIVIALRGRGTADTSLPGTHFNDPKTASGQLYTHIPDTEPIAADPASHYPPVFGNHYDTPRPLGVYDSPIPEGNFIHDLEHGGIVILYNCPSGCPDEVSQFRGLLTSLPRSAQFNQVKLVVSPNAKIDHHIALLAWDYQQDLDSFDATAIRAFYQAHLDKGPEHAAI